MNRQHDQLVADAFTRLLRGTCKYPDQCRVDVNLDKREIHVLPHMADYPVLVGAQGRQVNALKYLASKCGFELQLNESFIGEREQKEDFEYQPGTSTASIRLLHDLCSVLFEKRPGFVCESVPDDKVQGQSLVVHIQPAGDTENNRTILAALKDVIFPYSYRQGFIVRIQLSRKSTNQPVKA